MSSCRVLMSMSEEMSELMIIAGIVESIPAAKIHSASLLEMLIPRCRLLIDHHAKTGAAKPINHAGKTITRASMMLNTFGPKIINGRRHTEERITPPKNKAQR